MFLDAMKPEQGLAVTCTVQRGEPPSTGYKNLYMSFKVHKLINLHEFYNNLKSN